MSNQDDPAETERYLVHQDPTTGTLSVGLPHPERPIEIVAFWRLVADEAEHLLPNLHARIQDHVRGRAPDEWLQIRILPEELESFKVWALVARQELEEDEAPSP